VIGPANLKLIRNTAAFQFTDLIADGDAVVEVYLKIVGMSVQSLDKLIVAMQMCGDQMVQKVMMKQSYSAPRRYSDSRHGPRWAKLPLSSAGVVLHYPTSAE
jgi:hypothetical protein